MSILAQIEQLRIKLVDEILGMTDLTPADIQVEITLTPPAQAPYHELVQEAKSLFWYHDSHKETSWYTTEQPPNGQTIVFEETEEGI